MFALALFGVEWPVNIDCDARLFMMFPFRKYGRSSKNWQIIAYWKAKGGIFEWADVSIIRPKMRFGVDYDSFSLLGASGDSVKQVFFATNRFGNG